MLKLEKHLKIDKSVAESPNLCDRFSEKDLSAIGDLCFQGYERDEGSRSKWKKRMNSAMDLAMQIQKAKTWPWQGCSNVVFPLVTIAALQFSARSYSNLIQGTDVVRYRVCGPDPDGELQKRADRIGSHMSWQVLEEDTAWEEQTDRLLINLAIVGCAFKKTYFDGGKGHNVSELVMAKDLVIDYWAKSVDDAARKTQIIPLYRNEVYERCADGRFKDIREEKWFQDGPPQQDSDPQSDNRQGSTPGQTDSDTPFRFLEQHRYLDLDGDGYEEPYIVTLEITSRCVVRIVARWESDTAVTRVDGEIVRIKATEHYTKFSFIPAPDGGLYDIGLGVLIGPLNESVNSGINQLLDSGTIQNSMGGFLGRGAKIRGGVYTMSPWEWVRVDSTGDDLRKSLVQFPERQPSNVMFQLLGLLIQYADRIAGTTEQMVGENPGQNTPAETSRNTLEQGMQVFSVVFRRVWRSLKLEFKKLHELNSLNLRAKVYYGSKNQWVTAEDYRGKSDYVVPVADPNIVSAGERFMQASAIRAAAMQVRGYNQDAVEINFLRSMKVDQPERFYPGLAAVGPGQPSEKIQVEQLRLQAKGMELQYRKWEFIQEQYGELRKLGAEIQKLNAEAAYITAQIGADKASHQLETLDRIVGMMTERHRAITERIKAVQAGESDDTEGSDGGGVRRVVGSPGHTGLPRSSPTVPDGPNGAVGSGLL